MGAPPLTIAPVLGKLIVPNGLSLEESNAAESRLPLPVIVKRRSVLWAEVNWVACRVPPPKTKFEAALLEEPRLLGGPPLPRESTFIVMLLLVPLSVVT